MKRIHLISGPRNISTALMYSFAQREDTTVVDEPFYGYFLRTSGIKHPGMQATMNSMSCDVEEVKEKVIFGQYDTPLVFLKDMAKHLINMDLTFLHDLTNVFLIRDPTNLIASFAKVIPDMDEAEIGYQNAWTQFKRLQEKGNQPLVVDSGILLSNPEPFIRKLCEQLAIPYRKEMLTWKAGPRPEDGTWAKYWYKSVHQSTGFEQRIEEKRQVPEHLKPLLKEVQPYYEQLLHYAIKI